MKYLTVVAQLDASTEFEHWHNPTLDEVCVNASNVRDLAVGIWASDPEDLERLAAECTAAANALRQARDERLRVERETRRDHDHCDAVGCTAPVSGGIAGNGIEWQWCEAHRPPQEEIDAHLEASA